MEPPKSETAVSLDAIAERADKLEAEKPVEPVAEEKPAEPAAEAPKPEAAAPKPEEKKPEPTIPNDPNELRKWNTKVSMELADVKKQIQGIADALSKSTKKVVDWKELAKDPAKLQGAIDELNGQINKEWQEKYDTAKYSATAKITQKENQRRFHDANYPRWAELNPVVVKLAAAGDSRVDFEADPDIVLDKLYDLAAQEVAKDPNYKAPAPAPTPRADLKYSEQELQAKIAAAVKSAKEEAQKSLKAEESAAGVGGMGNSAKKGPATTDKAALWNAPMDELKAALQRASNK
jgi:hypothetical protein